MELKLEQAFMTGRGEADTQVLAFDTPGKTIVTVVWAHTAFADQRRPMVARILDAMCACDLTVAARGARLRAFRGTAASSARSWREF